MSGASGIIVAPDAEIVGRQVRRILDDGIFDDSGTVAGSVGDFEADRAALDEFVRDAARDATALPS